MNHVGVCSWFWACVLVGLLACTSSAAPPVVEFERDIRPIFVQHCYACHGPDKQRGGLRLDRKAEALQGGDSGAVIIPRKPADSLLLQLVSGADPDRKMPPQGAPLGARELGLLKAWIAAGADWPDHAGADDPLQWWSLLPLEKPAVPNLPGVAHPIDRFLRVKLRDKGLTPSPAADRRTLIRRVTFDLTGLPPTPEEIEAFVADASPQAYERLVDRLLASPHYGERWARHWLDVVHYGDTHGYDKDKPRPHAWPYRDYVIRSLNADKPYARFVQEQLAGDVLYPGTRDGITALGFIAAGPWDFIGHAEVPETKIDGKIARHLDRDDMVANALNTFVSLTVQCAQCHNHKFDPISQREYYQLQAVFAALDRADRPFHEDPAQAQRYEELQAESRRITRELNKVTQAIATQGGPELAELDRQIATASQPKAPRPEYGYHSQIEPKADRSKWVQVDLKDSVQITRMVLWPCHDDFNKIGAGFGFPVRYRVEASDDASFRAGVHLLVDRTAEDVPNPGVAPQEFAIPEVQARYIRVTATRLAPRQNDFIFALAELEAFDGKGINQAAGATVSAGDSIEAPPRWRRSNLTDGYAPGKTTTGDLKALQAERKALLAKRVDAAQLTEERHLQEERARIEQELQKVQPTGKVYAGVVHHGQGAFRGTGPDGGKPRPIPLLRRGDVTQPGEVVPPGTLNLIRDLPGAFALPPEHSEGERRAALARWITDAKNPLAWRSIVNRVWQYHFGNGLVATPNDFGRMGQLPSHPELLDWLAADFRDGGQSLKALHRLIVTSGAYKQASLSHPEGERIDAGNVYLWRAPRRKLEAEAIRDAALMVAGKLDRTLGGPPFQDFVIERPEHSPHYQYHLHDPTDPRAYRRSVYRFLVRSKPQPFMTVLDCADPSMQVEKRTETLSPLQALALYNNAFMLTMARHFAERIEKDPDPVMSAYRHALGRDPTPAERDAVGAYAREHGLASACRLILNLNEFVFVD